LNSSWLLVIGEDHRGGFVTPTFKLPAPRANGTNIIGEDRMFRFSIIESTSLQRTELGEAFTMNCPLQYRNRLQFVGFPSGFPFLALDAQVIDACSNRTVPSH
jgi:hypothetical protein